MYVRRSARVAVLDAEDRVLLLHARFRRSVPGVDLAWFLPGGGVEHNEDLTAAAVRELAEETGIAVDQTSLTALAHTEGDGTVGELTGPMRDDVFVTRAPSTAVSTAGMEEHERRALDRHRWWPLAALADTDEMVFPVGLAAVLRDFTAAHCWPDPRQLPW
ncbi:NUDIX hydrolase [Microlunatus soli]|nr:NUDIX domain-containing protein [Microlunatus soli]